MIPVTPRLTRLLRTASLAAFREALVAMACEGEPLAARDRLIVLPTRAAAAHLVRCIEAARFPGTDAVLLPDLTTSRDLVWTLGNRLPPVRPVLGTAEREVLLGIACRTAEAAGTPPPFRVRPGIVAEMLRFYDSLRRHQKDVETFGRLALGRLEPGAEIDRGAERLVRQTRFLVAAFRDFERRAAGRGDDEHRVRDRLLAEPAPDPVRHVIVAAGDAAFDSHGLASADWDLLARLPGVARLDVLVTDTTLAGAMHERIHQLLPDIEEIRYEPQRARGEPALIVPSADSLVHRARDREEEIAACARRAKRAARGGGDLDRRAIVVAGPLPYVYMAREVFRSGGVPLQVFAALPLAAEPYAAAVDLVCTAAASRFARAPAIALLRSALFAFGAGPDAAHGAEAEPAESLDSAPGGPGEGARGARVGAWLQDVAALDRALTEAGYLGDVESLDRLIEGWRGDPAPPTRPRRAMRAASRLRALARELEPLLSPKPAADMLGTVIGFLERHEAVALDADPPRSRQLRARGAVMATLHALRDAYASLDPTPMPLDDLIALVRRSIDAQTFVPRESDQGVHLIDAASAPFGDFEAAQLAGVVESEWPPRPRRNIFYSPEILRELGWPSERERYEAARARFADLLRLPSREVLVSAFSLDADAVIGLSPLAEEIASASLPAIEDPAQPRRIFEHEALGLEPLALDAPDDIRRRWALHRQRAPDRADTRFQGFTEPHDAARFSLSALERYQDCPFKYFAANVLGIEEEAEDESAVSPRRHGRLVHEVFEQFFRAWDAAGNGPITPRSVDEARALCERVAAPLLGALPAADAALERARLFGSPISVGAVDVLLALEASRAEAVEGRWLEHRMEGEFALGVSPGDGRRVALRGVADRVDLLPGRRLRVIDYKSGAPPHPKRALQAAVYALCAQEHLSRRDGRLWAVEEAAYVALAGRRSYVPVVRPGQTDATETLASARSRLFELADAVAAGAFPVRPHDPALCRHCSFGSVCRVDAASHD